MYDIFNRFFIFIWTSLFLLGVFWLSNIRPSAEYGRKLTLTEKIKDTFAIHKKFMKIKFIHDKVYGLWISLGKPAYPLPEDIVVIKLLFFIVTFVLFWIMGVTYGAPLFGAVAFFLPDWYFSNKAAVRLREIERNFPAALDLLTLCVDAGIDFMAALSKIIENMDPNPLMDEFQEIIREMQLGSDRKQALKNFSNRCDLEIVNSFVSVVIQAEELGTSLSGVLKDYSSEMKVKRFQSAEKQAMEAPVKMLIPMMIFIFPGILILTVQK
jgi:Flp pilus assembly protein TadB